MWHMVGKESTDRKLGHPYQTFTFYINLSGEPRIS